MKFQKIEQEIPENRIVCHELQNDILFRKYIVKENDLLQLQDKQALALVEYGEVEDMTTVEGFYQVKAGEASLKQEEMCKISKSEQEPLSAIFINQKVIQDNKYSIQKPIAYKEYTDEEDKEYWIKIDGHFDFCIIDATQFLRKVIGLRNHFSKQELIEQIRKYILKSIESGLVELSEDYQLSIEAIKSQSKEWDIPLKKNVFDEKILEYGVKLTYFDIENLEIVDKRIKKFFK